jgi:osmotically-inducible protein OsmY
VVAQPVAEETLVCSPDDSVLVHPHRLEQDIRHQLMYESNLNFTSLVVRRLQDGVLLEGVLELDAEDDSTDIVDMVRRASGVQRVLNSVVIRRTRELPRKG